MADLFNFNTGDSSFNSNNSLNNSNLNGNSSANSEYQHNWLRTPRPFGLNVRVPEAQPLIGENTEALIKKTAKELLLAPVKEVANFFKKYEKVFSGEVAAELKSLYIQRYNTTAILQDSDERVYGVNGSNFMMDM